MVIENLGTNDTVVGGTLPQRMISCLDTIDIFLQQSTTICPIVSSYVLAEKLQKSSASASSSTVSLIETIANILGELTRWFFFSQKQHQVIMKYDRYQ